MRRMMETAIGAQLTHDAFASMRRMTHGGCRGRARTHRDDFEGSSMNDTCPTFDLQSRLVDRVGTAWGFTPAERRDAQIRALKDQLNALTAKVLAGDQNAAVEAERVQGELTALQTASPHTDVDVAPRAPMSASGRTLRGRNG